MGGWSPFPSVTTDIVVDPCYSDCSGRDCLSGRGGTTRGTVLKRLLVEE